MLLCKKTSYGNDMWWKFKINKDNINFAIDSKTFERNIYIDTNGVEYIKYNKKIVKTD